MMERRQLLRMISVRSNSVQFLGASDVIDRSPSAASDAQSDRVLATPLHPLEACDDAQRSLVAFVDNHLYRILIV